MESKVYHHGNLRSSLIDAGIEIINREGLKQFSLRKVAALCGVSHAAPYKHFKDKEKLIEAISEHISIRFTEIFNDIIQNNEKNDPTVLKKMGEAYFIFFKDNPQYFRFLFFQDNPKINLSLDDPKRDSFPAFQIFKDTASLIFRNAGMEKELIEDMIIMQWAFVHGFTSIAVMKGVKYDKDWKTKINQFLFQV